MSDYEKLKATELKTLLKDRGIAATGLTKKAQYIQALIEDDERTNDGSAGAEGETAEEIEAATEAVDNPTAENQTQEHAADEQKAEATDVDAPVVASENTVQQAPPSPPDDEQEMPAAAEEAPAQHAQPSAVDESTSVVEQTSSLDRKRKRDVSTAVGEQDAEGTPKKAKAEVADDTTMTDAHSTVPVTDSTSSSQHPPTAALYIRNLMRPLQRTTLSDYLAELAGSPVAQIHLDAMKTHAFAVFESTAAARSVRDQLHDRVWPEESQRKALWIDFVPEDKVSAWIEQEEGSGRDTRFEVTYYTDSTGAAEVNLVELNARPSQRPPRPDSPHQQGQGVPGAPQGPRGHRAAERGSTRDYPPQDSRPEQSSRPPQQQQQQQQQQQGGTFSKLDQYFSFTNAKPKIYFKPVDPELANARLAEFDRETSRDWDGGRAWNRSTRLTPIDQLRRYTFEDGDKIVDGGADFGGFGKRQYAGGTGPFIPSGAPRGRGGRGGGGYRGGY